MAASIKKELHYQYRSARLCYGFFAKRFMHCNLQLTYDCNFKCDICDFWKDHDRYSGALTVPQVREIGQKLNKLGTLIVSLAGGEPLIRKDLYDIITTLNDCNQFPILITNGWYVDETVAKDIHRAGLQEISVSVDYVDPKRHDAQRRTPGAWERAIRALELLNKHRPDRRNRVHMISVLMDDNLDDIEPMIKLAKEIGVTYMVNLYSWNRGTKQRRLPHEQVTRRLLELKKQYPEFISLTSYIAKMDQAIADGGIGNCQTGRLLMNIDPKGNVSRCTEMLDQPVGNILNEDISAIRDKLYNVHKDSTCAQCWTSCRGFAESMQQPPRARQFKEFFHSVKKY